MGRAGSAVRDALGSPGRPLSRSTRAFMEPRFGRDLGDVRVHTGAKAAESARAVSALAYSVGRDVVFGAGQYAPETSAGRRLLAHELAHTMQQGASSDGVLRRLADPNCGSAAALPLSSSCASFHNTCYSDSFTASGGTTVTATVNVNYDSDDCSFPSCREDFRVTLRQCGWKDTEVKDFGTSCIGAPLSDTATLPGAGILLGNDNYYLRVYTRSQCSVTAQINVR